MLMDPYVLTNKLQTQMKWMLKTTADSDELVYTWKEMCLWL